MVSLIAPQVMGGDYCFSMFGIRDPQPPHLTIYISSFQSWIVSS